MYRLTFVNPLTVTPKTFTFKSNSTTDGKHFQEILTVAKNVKEHFKI